MGPTGFLRSPRPCHVNVFPKETEIQPWGLPHLQGRRGQSMQLLEPGMVQGTRARGPREPLPHTTSGTGGTGKRRNHQHKYRPGGKVVCVRGWPVTRTERDPVKGTETGPGHRVTLKDLGIYHRSLVEGGYTARRRAWLEPYLNRCVTEEGTGQWGYGLSGTRVSERQSQGPGGASPTALCPVWTHGGPRGRSCPGPPACVHTCPL